MKPTPTIPIETLTHSGKLDLMERLWSDLSRNPSDISTPDWHGDILAQRLADACEGKQSFVVWEDVKQRLQDRHDVTISLRRDEAGAR